MLCKAEGLLTIDATEMRVSVIVIISVVRVADLIACGTTTIIDNMYNVLLYEEIESTKYR